MSEQGRTTGEQANEVDYERDEAERQGLVPEGVTTTPEDTAESTDAPADEQAAATGTPAPGQENAGA